MIRRSTRFLCACLVAATSAHSVTARPRRGHRVSAGAAVAHANSAATLRPSAPSFVNANQVYPYAEGAIFQLITAPERVTDIALQPGESLGAVAAGDTARWVIGDTTSGSGATKQTHVLVKPFAPGLQTNIIITTDRRTYHVALVSTPGVAMSAISWTYPADALLALRAAESAHEAVQPVATGLDVEHLNFGYAIAGPDTPWHPLRAFDDGRQTFIQFPDTLASAEAPPLFLLDSAGGTQLVNYRVRGHYYVVDRLFDAAELRIGGKDAIRVRITRMMPKTGRSS